MITINMTICLDITTDMDDDALEATLDQLMDALLDLEAANEHVCDAAMGANLADRTVEVTLAGTGETEGHAFDLILGTVRAAIHTTGGGTPNWPGVDEAMTSGAVTYERSGTLVNA